MGRLAKRAASVEAGDKPAQEHILDRATELFADKGFDGVSLRDVTTHAEVGMATVYYHFKDKAGLYAAVFRRSVTLCAERLATAAPGDGPPEARIRRFFMAYYDMVAGGAPDFRLVEQELMRCDPERWNALAAAVYAPPHNSLKSVLIELAGTGVADDVVDFHARAAIGLAYGMIKLRHLQAHVAGAGTPVGGADLAQAMTVYVVSAVGRAR